MHNPQRARTPRTSAVGLALGVFALANGCGDTSTDLDGGTLNTGGDNTNTTGGVNGGAATSGTNTTGGDMGNTTGAGNTTGGDGSTTGGTTGAEADSHPHQACVDRINELRATLSLPPLQRWVDAEKCSDMQSGNDHTSGAAHGNFGDCQEFGQNTCPDWPSQDSISKGCLDQMWAEGPAPGATCDDACFQMHGHYLNMTSTEFTKVACGFYDDGAGQVWSNQNYK